jgi:uncharacterized phage-associated protein
MPAKHTATEVAHFILSKADPTKGDSITPLKLQKLVYYSQAWHFTLFGEPLFDDAVEAWAHGPVIRAVWDEYKGFASRNQPIDLSKVKMSDVHIKSKKTARLLNDVIRIYAEHTGAYLERLTHNESPWKDAREGLTSYQSSTNEITLQSMRKYYRKLSAKK